ncbi:hypothetical protein PVAND_003315 [Polypedilum vanderplanki]|uniref:Metalloendopeptidase n=1 Tax=Polypedilum vanderplanki TaxID=319348 RepID=A0A9J6BTP5_POLVA|nr:hypothetical protein PVAND_003315 [Polypedilum vanderplanki]
MNFLVVWFYIFSLLYAAPIEEKGEEISSEYGNFFHGDIMLTPEQERELSNEGRDGRSGILYASNRWPKIGNLVYVPYVINSEYSLSDVQKIVKAINEFNDLTCIRFVLRDNQADYINIVNGTGCSSYIGRISGPQTINLRIPGCLSHGIIMHEFIHALGYQHMHSDERRDSYVKINWDNIQDEYKRPFEKLNSKSYGNFGTSYDLDSVMHYSGTAFSKNRKLTIETLDPNYQNRIGQRKKLSSGDVIRINNMYDC